MQVIFEHDLMSETRYKLSFLIVVTTLFMFYEFFFYEMQ